MVYLILFNVILFVVLVTGQGNLDSTIVIENEAGILEQVGIILSDFSRLQLNNLGSAVSSALNFLIANGVKLFNVLDPTIVS